MILVDALYINNGGGKTLLQYFIEEIERCEDPCSYIFIIDDRLDKDWLASLNLRKAYIIKSGEISRTKVYKTIFKDYSIKTIFCLNNLPPPIHIKFAQVFIYFHNILLLNPLGSNYKFHQKIKFLLKLFYIKQKNRVRYKWIVQTKLVKDQLLNKIRIHESHVSIIPFYKVPLNLEEGLIRIPRFLYVADGSTQKNHALLFDTFERLATDFNQFPELVVTIDKTIYPEVNRKIEDLNRKGILIHNLGTLTTEDLHAVYKSSEYCIYPSLHESFGLPLIEAVQFGCKVVAIDMPYVHEVIEPSALFPYAHNGKQEVLVDLLLDIICNKKVLKPSLIIVNSSIQELIDLIKRN